MTVFVWHREACLVQEGYHRGWDLYAFKDAAKAVAEETCFIAKSVKDEDYEQDKYMKKKDLVGAILFRSD